MNAPNNMSHELALEVIVCKREYIHILNDRALGHGDKTGNRIPWIPLFKKSFLKR